MKSVVNRIYDADTKFRAPGSAAVTATAVVGVLALDKMTKVRPSDQRGKLGAEAYEIVIVVSDIKAPNADETFTFTVDVGATGAAATTVATLVVNKVGQFVIQLDAQTIEALDADHAEIELNATLAGTAPSITFTSWLGVARKG